MLVLTLPSSVAMRLSSVVSLGKIKMGKLVSEQIGSRPTCLIRFWKKILLGKNNMIVFSLTSPWLAVLLLSLIGMLVLDIILLSWLLQMTQWLIIGRSQLKRLPARHRLS